MKRVMTKGLSLHIQRPGLPDTGPLTPFLKAMATMDNNGKPVSPLGWEVAGLFALRKTWVMFTHTAGSGITPWRGLIILDSDYKGEGQIQSPATIGLVAHELTHLLQRELNQPYYWPSGGFRPVLRRLWIADSTNYMEVLAYLVGWTVEHDLRVQQIKQGHLSEIEREHRMQIVKLLRNRIATLAGADARNACRLLLKTYPDNPVYRRNYIHESRLPDGRIPGAPWHIWLRTIGFSIKAVDHIMIVAAQGKAEMIDEASIPQTSAD